jgi:hypothetical protein
MKGESHVSIIEPALLMSMSDIATLARVQRPVVSVWRSRSTLTDSPFPAPVAERNGRELFDAHAVGAWLSGTRHGNNPDASADAAAHAILDGQARTGADTFRAVTALLTLRSAIGEPLGALSGTDLIDAADEHDPDDDAFYREIEAIGAASAGLVGYVDALVEAAYGEAEAFERLLADRFKREPQCASDTTLNDLGLDLIARTALALAATQPSEPVFVDATGGAGDVLLAIARTESSPGDVTVVTANDDSDTARMVRRRLLVHRVARDGLEVQPAGAFSVTGRAVHVAQLPSATELRMSAAGMLSAIEQIVLQMDDDQLAVVLAPSAVLSDSGLSRDTDAVRSSLLRSGRVRAIVRLPAGLLTYKPQQVQTLWVLGAAHARVPLADRWTMVADLSARRLNPTAIEDLVSDLVAARGERGPVRARLPLRPPRAHSHPAREPRFPRRRRARRCTREQRAGYRTGPARRRAHACAQRPGNCSAARQRRGECSGCRRMRRPNRPRDRDPTSQLRPPRQPHTAANDGISRTATRRSAPPLLPWQPHRWR